VSPYKTETCAEGSVTVSVTATGELKPVTQVNIGTEISGIVESVAVDFNSQSPIGQVLARVNTEKLEAQAAQARAALRAAEAKATAVGGDAGRAEAALARLQQVANSARASAFEAGDGLRRKRRVKRARAEPGEYGRAGRAVAGELDAIETDIRKAIIRRRSAASCSIVKSIQVRRWRRRFKRPRLFTSHRT
jgi:HlyD family secretion protein